MMSLMCLLLLRLLLRLLRCLLRASAPGAGCFVPPGALYS
jgi:hypothetical protein